MVLTKSELIGTLQNEVRILQHLITKIDKSALDYRPTPKQRSTLELLQYLTIMGPQLIAAAKKGSFDRDAWGAAVKESVARDFDQTVATLAAQKDVYASLLGDMSDADFRTEVDMFTGRASRGQFIVTMVVGGHAAYRTQLFLYLKSCGRADLGTMNLWGGMDPQPQ